jgi:hypothetical protein
MGAREEHVACRRPRVCDRVLARGHARARPAAADPRATAGARPRHFDMKKADRRPLHLDRTTLRALTGAALARAAGGSSHPTVDEQATCDLDCVPHRSLLQ